MRTPRIASSVLTSYLYTLLSVYFKAIPHVFMTLGEYVSERSNKWIYAYESAELMYRI